MAAAAGPRGEQKRQACLMGMGCGVVVRLHGSKQSSDGVGPCGHAAQHSPAAGQGKSVTGLVDRSRAAEAGVSDYSILSSLGSSLGFFHFLSTQPVRAARVTRQLRQLTQSDASETRSASPKGLARLRSALLWSHHPTHPNPYYHHTVKKESLHRRQKQDVEAVGTVHR